MTPMDELVDERPRSPDNPRKNAQKVTRSVGVSEEYFLAISVMCINATGDSKVSVRRY